MHHLLTVINRDLHIVIALIHSNLLSQTVLAIFSEQKILA